MDGGGRVCVCVWTLPRHTQRTAHVFVFVLDTRER
jgi:hypothetical protein